MSTKRSREPEQGSRVMFEFGVMLAILLAVALACELGLRISGLG